VILIHAILLGIVQGLTEFLPVSSSAHLILARAFFGWDAERLGLAFDVACHVGTLTAVVLYFRRDLWDMARSAPAALSASARGPGRMLQLVAVGSLPVVPVGLLLGGVVDRSLRTPQVAAATLAAGALVFLLAERFGRLRRGEGSISIGEALGLGLAQASALVPGVSRSGATIAVAMLFGLKRDSAARFSFLLGVPAILMAGAHEGLGLLQVGLAPGDAVLFAAGMAVSAVVGYFTVKYFLRYLSRHSLHPFAWYRLALAASVTIWWVAR
jgi:undecaprenyl-diphosphatase